MVGTAWLQCSLSDMRPVALPTAPSVRWMCSIIYLSIYCSLPAGYSWSAAAIRFPSSMITEVMSFVDSSALYIRSTMASTC